MYVIVVFTMKYNTYTSDSMQQHKIKSNKIKSSGQLLWPTASMLIYTVSDDACQWNGHDVVISIGGIFFIERSVCCMMKKSWTFSDLVAAISAALHEFFVRSKYANSVYQFLLYL